MDNITKRDWIWLLIILIILWAYGWNIIIHDANNWHKVLCSIITIFLFINQFEK